MLKNWDNHGIPLCKRSHQKDVLHIMLCEIHTFHHFMQMGLQCFPHLCIYSWMKVIGKISHYCFHQIIKLFRINVMEKMNNKKLQSQKEGV
jgi:hypothetical protein